jgi:hypothetical protein
MPFSVHLNIEDNVYLRKHRNQAPEDGSLRRPSNTLLEALKLTEIYEQEEEQGNTSNDKNKERETGNKREDQQFDQ